MNHRDLDRFGGMELEFRKWYLEQTYSEKGAIGKRKHTGKKRTNEESTLKMVNEKKRSLSRLGEKSLCVVRRVLLLFREEEKQIHYRTQ